TLASVFIFFFQAEDGIRDFHVTGVQTCALPIWRGLPPGGKLISLVPVALRTTERSSQHAGIRRGSGISGRPTESPRSSTGRSTRRKADGATSAAEPTASDGNSP